MDVRFIHDNDVCVCLPENHSFSQLFKNRQQSEVYFRKIVTFLINNGYITHNMLDAGAWIGDNSIPWAMNLGPKSVVYAIDPCEGNCQFLTNLCSMNNVKNICVMPFALSDIEETLSSHSEHDLYKCVSFVRPNGTKIRGRKHKVKAYSLDGLYEEQIITDVDFMHIDVEGMEYLVLKGALKLIHDCLPIIAFEQNIDTENYENIVNLLHDQQYYTLMLNESFSGCQSDCRNFLAIPFSKMTNTLVDDIHKSIGKVVLTRITR